MKNVNIGRQTNRQTETVRTDGQTDILPDI